MSGARIAVRSTRMPGGAFERSIKKRKEEMAATAQGEPES